MHSPTDWYCGSQVVVLRNVIPLMSTLDVIVSSYRMNLTLREHLLSGVSALYPWFFVAWQSLLDACPCKGKVNEMQRYLLEGETRSFFFNLGNMVFTATLYILLSNVVIGILRRCSLAIHFAIGQVWRSHQLVFLDISVKQWLFSLYHRWVLFHISLILLGGGGSFWKHDLQ